MTTDILLALHFIGLMMGAAGGMSTGLIMRRAAAAPGEQAGAMRSLGPHLTRFALLGIALMWIAGMSLVFVKYNGFSALPLLFWVKLVFVGALTIAAIAIELTYGQIKAGNQGAAARLPILGPIAGFSTLLAVIFAVFAFH